MHIVSEDFLHQPHYRDRLQQKCFENTEFKSLFGSWEGGALIMWRWGSLVNVLKALKRRQGPLMLYFDAEAYINTPEDEAASRSKALKSESGNKKWSKGDAMKFAEIVKDSFFWAYLVPWHRASLNCFYVAVVCGVVGKGMWCVDWCVRCPEPPM